MNAAGGREDKKRPRDRIGRVALYIEQIHLVISLRRHYPYQVQGYRPLDYGHLSRENPAPLSFFIVAQSGKKVNGSFTLRKKDGTIGVA